MSPYQNIKPSIKSLHEDLIIKNCTNAKILACGYMRNLIKLLIRKQLPELITTTCASYMTYIDCINGVDEYDNSALIINKKKKKKNQPYIFSYDRCFLNSNWTIDIASGKHYKCSWDFSIYDIRRDFKIGFWNNCGSLLFQYGFDFYYCDLNTNDRELSCELYDYLFGGEKTSIYLIPISRGETRFTIVFDTETQMSWIDFNGVKLVFNKEKKSILSSLPTKLSDDEGLTKIKLFCKIYYPTDTQIKLNSFNVMF